MSVPTNLIPTKITGLPEYTGNSTLGYFPYVLEGRTYQVQFANLAAVGAVPSTRVVAAGTGLTGGGDLSQDRVIAIANGGVGYSQLANSGVTAGSYGSGSQIPVLTIDDKGRVTSASSVSVTISGYVPDSRRVDTDASLTGGGPLSSNLTLGVNYSASLPQALGTASAGVSTAAARGDHVHPAVNLSDATQTQGALPLGRGGTGDALSPVAGAVVYSTGTKFALADPGLPGQVLTSAGTGEPYWTTVTGTGTVTSVAASGGTTGMTFSGSPITAAGTLTLGGTLNVASGGTGATTASTARANLGAAASGANSDITSMSGITGAIASPDYIDFDTAATVTRATGRLWWDNADGNQTLSLGMAGGNATLQIGEEMYFRIKASSAITEGQVVMFTGTVGASGALTGAPATGLTKSTASYIMGVATEDIALNGWGYVTQFGLVRGINTTGGAEAWVDGQILYYDPTVPGGLTKNQPTAPAAKVEVAAVIYAASNGSLFVRPSARFELTQLNDVESSGATNLDLLQYNGTGGYWQHRSPSTISVGSATNLVGGTANQIPYQTGVGATSFISAPVTPNTFLEWSGTAFQWSSNPLGTVTSVDASGGTTGLTFSGGPITTSGTLTLSGTLGVANGGTGATSLSSGYVLKGNGTSAVSASVIYDDGSGIGIGTATPSATLDVQGNIYAASTIRADGGIDLPAGFGTYWRASLPSGAYQGGLTYNGGLRFYSGDVVSERMRLDSSGNLGIGTSSPVYKLDVAGDIALKNNATYLLGRTTGGAATRMLGINGGNDLYFGSIDAAVSNINFTNNGTVQAVLTSAGNLGIGTSSPVGRLTLQGAAGTNGINQGLGLLYSNGTQFGALGLNNSTGWPQLMARAGAGLTFHVNSDLLTTGEAMRITSAGNVGIGTTAPSNQLSVGGNISATISFDWTGDNAAKAWIAANHSTGEVRYAAVTNYFPTFYSNNSERMRIDLSGNVGIGTSSPGAKLDVNGIALASTDASTGNSPLVAANISTANNTTKYTSLLFQGRDTVNTGKNVGLVLCGPSDQNWVTSYLAFQTRNADALVERMRITTDGNVGIGTSGPGSKLTIQQDQAAYSYFDYYNVTNGGGVVWRQIVRNLANTGTTSVDLAKLIGGGFTINNNDTGAANYTAFGIGGSERMRIDSSGNLGIGTSSPGSKLHVNGSGFFSGSNSITGTGVNIEYIGGGAINCKNFTSGTWDILDYGASTHSFYINGSGPAMRIDSSSKVGIGTSSPSAKLHISGSSVGNSNIRLTNTLAPRSWEFNPYTTGDSDSKFAIRDVTAAADRIAIDSSGNVGIGTTSPNAKLDVVGSITMGAALLTGTGISTGDAQIELGGNRTGDGNAYIDWHATAGTDLESRIIRYGGANGGMDIINMGTGGMVISQEGAAPMVFKTTATERMRISSGGAVGIGTSNPAYALLQVSASGAEGFEFQPAVSSSVNRILSYNRTSNAYNSLRLDGSDQQFYTGGTERARINSSGDVLVNTSTTFGKLSVYGTTGFNADANAAISGSGSFKFRGTAAGTTITTYDYLNYTAVQFIRDNGNPTNTVGSITCTDGSTSYNTSSDRRLKKDIVPAGDAGATIDAIEIVSHGWKASEGTVPFGVIAQDLHAVAPQAVHAGDDGEEVSDVWGVDYSKLVPMLVKEIQSLRARVAQLEGM